MSKISFFIMVLLLQGCASIVSNSAYPVYIESNVDKSEFVIYNRYGLEVKRGRTPSVAVLESGIGFFKRNVYTVEFSAPGFQTQSYPLNSRLNGWFWGNFIMPIGFLADSFTGAMWRLPLRLTAELPEENFLSMPIE